jgi:hypothetical protein
VLHELDEALTERRVRRLTAKFLSTGDQQRA